MPSCKNSKLNFKKQHFEQTQKTITIFKSLSQLVAGGWAQCMSMKFDTNYFKFNRNQLGTVSGFVTMDVPNVHI